VKKWTWILGLTAAVVIGVMLWTPNVRIQTDEELGITMLRAGGEAEPRVPLADLTPGLEWDTVHTFGGYTGIDEIEDEIGARISRPGLGFLLGSGFVQEGGRLLVFTMNGSPVRASLIPPVLTKISGANSTWHSDVEVDGGAEVSFHHPAEDS